MQARVARAAAAHMSSRNTACAIVKDVRPKPAMPLASGIAGFGRTSFTIAQAVFRDDMCAAAARATLACIDLDTRKPRPIPEDAIERLSKWKYLGA